MSEALLKIGITGGIGSGKSYVSRLLKERGIPVYDTDSEAKRLMSESADIRRGLIDLLGADVYCPDGSLDKSVVASFLFASRQNADRINAIVHPVVKSDFLSWVSRHQGIVAMECAILFESGFSDVVDFVVAVTAPLDLRVSRTMLRDNTSKASVLSRINAQMDDEERVNKSDFVIENDGFQSIPEQLDELLSVLEARKKSC